MNLIFILMSVLFWLSALGILSLVGITALIIYHSFVDFDKL